MATAQPLSLVRWWAAVQAAGPREPQQPVLRASVGGRTFEVLTRDLDAACRILESCASSGRADPSSSPDTTAER